MEWWRDSRRDGEDGSRLLGLKFLSDLIFRFTDLLRRLRNDRAWRGETIPTPRIYLPLWRWSSQPEERSLVRCAAEPYFPAPVTILWSFRWYGFAPPEAAI
ncbi:hypothetical protein Bca101_017742 [Brassica carinata]